MTLVCRNWFRFALAGWAALFANAAACLADDDPPPTASAIVDFATQVRPILEKHCVECHARGHRKGGFSIETRDELLAGGESGFFVKLGDSANSRLTHILAGTDDELFMPDNGEILSESEVGLIRGWIDQGATWPAGFSFGFPTTSLALSPSKLPPKVAGASSNAIDRLLAPYLAEHDLTLNERSDDRRFIRRVSLDLVGLLPTYGQVESYATDTRPHKHLLLVSELLADRQNYAEHWLTFWNDLLRNDYQGTGFIDSGRKQITAWLYRALYDNMPYDEFARRLVSPTADSEGFSRGIVWRGVVNASQMPEMQAAQNVGQVFLGTNLKCASCHDSFVNRWKLSDAYALASVFATEPLEIHRCDAATGAKSNAAFLFPELGSIDDDAPREERMRRLAELLTSQDNGRFSRTIVNRLWAVFFGRGLVEPLDDLDQPAWHAGLLDWLAADLTRHDYDLKRTMRLIATSDAYRAKAGGAPPPEARDAVVFRGSLVRRMSAEQFLDALGALSGQGAEHVNDRMLKLDGRGQGGQLAAALAARTGEPVEKFTPKKGSERPDECPESVRASLATASALAAALGRPNREQVVTRRDSAATTLQAVELNNGRTLDQILQEVADHQRSLVAELPRDQRGAAIVANLFHTALGREATAAEQAIALDLLGDDCSRESVADLAWTVVMLPEFQLLE